MKKIKFLGLGTLMLVGALFISNNANARKITYAYIFPNGCIGTHTYHSTLFGLVNWESFEEVAC